MCELHEMATAPVASMAREKIKPESLCAFKRSQTGVVVKFGTNVVAWISMKQTEVSMNTAESEVQAVASTVVLADYIKALRESLCSPTPIMELRCDNTSAIVLSTGKHHGELSRKRITSTQLRKRLTVEN